MDRISRLSGYRYSDRLDAMPTEPNWDTYKGLPTSDEAKATAEAMVPVPTADGGIQLDLHAGGIELEIEIAPDGRVQSVYWERR